MEEIKQTTHSIGEFLSFPLFLLPTSLIILTTLFLKTHHKKNSLLPPSPPRLPLLGHLHLLSALPHYPLKELSKNYGPIMLLYFGSKPTVIISSIEAAQEVLKNQDSNFATRPISPVTSLYSYGSRNVSFAPNGEHWRQARKACVLHLLSPSRVQAFTKIRAEEVRALVGKISKFCSLGSLNMSEILYGFSSGLICRAVAGECLEREERTLRFREIIEEVVKLIMGPSLEDILPGWRWVVRVCGGSSRVKKMLENRDEVLEEILREHERKKREEREEEREEEVDFIDLLLKYGESDGGYGFSRDDIKTIFMDLIGAGTDTTYVVLEWAMSELIKNPIILKNLQEEILQVGLQEDDLLKAPLLHAFIKEVLRFHMPAPLILPREAISETRILGYTIPARTQVFINAWAMARDEELWDSPEKFLPERFMSSSKVDFRGQDMQFLPFGAGRRMCPGIEFGLCDIKIALAYLLYHFNWEMPHGESHEDLDMEEVSGLTIHRKTPLRLVAIPRRL